MKRRDHELEALMLVGRCQGAARRKVPTIKTSKPHAKRGAAPRYSVAPSIVIDGQAIELPGDAVRLILDWQALPGNEREIFERAIAKRAQFWRTPTAQ
jgi:hypothetical protein